MSNGKRDTVSHDEELRVVIATDVLSEGQNLQDCAIVVNYDLPWAIIRLAQRAGRVDRIGQQAAEILCYSFLPADGVERVLKLRARVRTRLRENAEVVGTDEAYFEDDEDRPILDLYNEQAGVLDGDDDTEVDLASYAYQIWKNATDDDPPLRRKIEDLPDVVYSTRAHLPLSASLPLEEGERAGVRVLRPPIPPASSSTYGRRPTTTPLSAWTTTGRLSASRTSPSSTPPAARPAHPRRPVRNATTT